MENSTTTIETAKQNAKNEWEKGFVESIERQLANGKSLSDRQIAILDRIVQYGTTNNSNLAEGPYMPLVSLLTRAGENLKKPKVTFMNDFSELQISLAPATGRNPGAIYLKANLGDYVGKVSSRGSLQLLRSLDEATNAQYTQLIDDLNADPVNAAINYGAKTGRCCFCHLPLKDERSTAHGYGPTCAKNWGLPWSTKTGRVVQEEQYENVRLDIHEAVGGRWNIVDRDTGGIIMTVSDRRTAEEWVDQYSTIERA